TGHRAGLDELPSVEGVRADGRHDDPCRPGEVGAGGRVGDVDEETGPGGCGATELRRDRVELRAGAAGDRDPEALRCMVTQVGGGEATDESGGADEDDVVVAPSRGGSHVPTLTRCGSRHSWRAGG